MVLNLLTNALDSLDDGGDGARRAGRRAAAWPS